MPNNRIIGFDFARAWAIVGMLLVNYKIVFSGKAVKYPLIEQLISLLEGRAAAVFLVLAGIGIGLMSKRAYQNKLPKQRQIVRFTLIKRAIFLFVLGIIQYVLFDWTADILHYYGIYMLAMSLLVFASNRTIIRSIIAVLITTFVLQISLDYMHAWADSMTMYTDFYTITGFLRHAFYNGYHPFFPWFTFLLVGLLISRLPLSRHTAKNMLILGTAGAITVEAISILLIAAENSSEIARYFFATKPMNPSLFYVFASSLWALAFIGLCLLVSQRFAQATFVKDLAATGQMALTHYVFHAVGVLSVFYMLNQLVYRDEIFVVVLSIIVFTIMILFSKVWSHKFGRGPLERLMRRLTQ